MDTVDQARRLEQRSRVALMEPAAGSNRLAADTAVGRKM